MLDPRHVALARQLVGYSITVQPGEVVYLELKGLETLDLGRQIIRAVTEAGGVPFWYYNDEDVSRSFVKHAGEKQFSLWAQFHKRIMQDADCYIAIRGSSNPFDHRDVAADRMKWYNQAYWDEVHSVRVNEKKWVVLRYPNPSMAIQAEAPTESFEDFYFQVCGFDYARMSAAMDPLKELLERTDRVELSGPGTDLSFSIKGLGAVKCDGHRNVPDGEVYSCPVRDSVNGVITYNAASMRDSVLFKNIRFECRDGKIVAATCDGDVAKLNEILDSDEGARYFGEFALGVNPFITEPMLDTLFDEKIGGSFHLTPGAAYAATDNGNKSAVHWDLVSIQTPAWGGGEIRFDGVKVREDGLFVLPELEGLNPENLTR
ncbi:aminopeptidase [bacterium]|nr:aminopeptidase [bacterium]MBU1074360.1 aminopeptidase [bacterium]MBU1676344.1 aminopeptidase [bacterium]